MCPSCGRKHKIKEARPGSSPAREQIAYEPLKVFYAQFGLGIEEVLAFKGRRFIRGQILSAVGITGLTSGTQFIAFDERALHLFMDSGYEIPYEKVRHLEIKGRGEIVSRSNAGLWGGGFGIKGAAEGMILAHVINALTTEKSSALESIIVLDWEGGSLAFLNRTFLPRELATVLVEFTTKIATHDVAVAPQDDHAQVLTAPNEISASLSTLAELRQTGMLTEDEFAAAKAKVLGE